MPALRSAVVERCSGYFPCGISSGAPARQDERNEQIAAKAIQLPPLGIAERQSSDAYAIDDPDVATAMRFIREHACNGISVADVLRIVPISRRVLEHRFGKLIHHTPHTEIVRKRIERATRLMRETDLPLSEVAVRSGFAHSTRLTDAFKKHLGITPGVYRRMQIQDNAATHL